MDPKFERIKERMSYNNWFSQKENETKGSSVYKGEIPRLVDIEKEAYLIAKGVYENIEKKVNSFEMTKEEAQEYDLEMSLWFQLRDVLDCFGVLEEEKDYIVSAY